MATAAGQIFLQYFDDDGNPLAGGTLTAYAAGTTNLLDIFSDSLGTVADNPITLDSAGRVDFYVGTSAYDFLIKNAAGDTIDTKDDYGTTGGGSSLTIVDNLAAMKALATGSFDYVMTGGYTTKGDGGHAVYRWNSTDTTADDAGRTIQPDSAPGTGRYNMLDNGYINDLSLNGSGDLELTPITGRGIILTSKVTSQKSKIASALTAIGIGGTGAGVSIDPADKHTITVTATDVGVNDRYTMAAGIAGQIIYLANMGIACTINNIDDGTGNQYIDMTPGKRRIIQYNDLGDGLGVIWHCFGAF